MLVLIAGKDLQTTELPFLGGVLRQHAADGERHGESGAGRHQAIVAGLLETAGVTGVGAVVLLGELVAGENGVLRVDDDDEVTAVNVRRVVNLALAAQQVGGESGGLAQGLAGRVENVPLASSFLTIVVDIDVPPISLFFLAFSRRGGYNIPSRRALFL